MMRVSKWFGRCALVVATMLLVSGTLVAETGGGPPDPAHHEADAEPVTAKDSTVGPKGVFDKAIEIKGTGVKIQFGGFAKVDFIQDFDPVGNENQFKVNSIPVAGDPDSRLGGNTNISARQTRFSVDVRNDSATGPVRAYVEGDFFGDGNGFRLRHGSITQGTGMKKLVDSNQL